MAELSIELMTLADVEAVHAIECACFAIPWSKEAFITEVVENKCARYLVLKEDGVPVAYAGVWFVLDEGHITNIAVRPDRQGNGYGEKITRALMQLSSDTGMAFLELEVRTSNTAAQRLYRKLGFQDVGLRKRYYADTGEDALLMACDQLPEAHPEDDPFLVYEE